MNHPMVSQLLMPLFNWSDVIFRNVQRSKNSSSWESGVVTGSIVATLLGMIVSVYPLWNSKLSFLLNIINVVDLKFGLGMSMLSRLRESDISGINKFRRLQLLAPLGPLRQMESSKIINVVSKHGHIIPVHVHTPLSHKKGSPLVIFIHGGGFVVGSPVFYESICTCIAKETGSVVIGIDYRKAPENKFPAAPLDCIEATQWIVQSAASEFDCDPNKICVLGDSAGGNLTAIVARELHESVSLSIPIYPVVFHGVLSQSWLDSANCPVLSSFTMDWFSLRYFEHRDQIFHPLAYPLAGPIEKLPRTHVITAECDVLRDEGLEYADVIREAGVDVTYKQYDNTCHGFFGAVSHAAVICLCAEYMTF
jgi:acetyl esterase